MPRPDLDLRSQDVLALSSRQGVASFFLSLGYDVQSLPQSADALGITDESLRRHIQYVEQLAVQEDDFGTLYVYLFEMRSMRVADRQALARSFRNKPGDYLFVITSDYESLDFVLLERQTPESQGTAFARKQVAVRPHVLTVDRRNPSPVALRVLRRFTFTEPDVLYQVDKLLSAYVVAAWSEAYFNNRALFSDYYLTARLPETAAWQESPDATYRALQDLFAAARERIAHEKAGETRTELVEPALRALGWAWRAGGATGDSQPDYTLTQPGGEEPLALCLAYPWNRHLDTPDPADPDRPDDIPGQRVVSVLAGGEAPYAILTNGKLWRLYAAQAHSRATNYYEIDLEETLNSPERATAIRYFWLFFRAAAFVPQAAEDRSLSFLDQVLEGSENYARELGERLKDRVFDDIFPHFAEGFIEHIRHTEGKDAALDQPRLDLIYQGTLTFLYRLMFLLYAEARDLLPVREARGYAEISLGRLKAEVAQKGGDIEDEAPGKLREAYSPSSTGLYERLSELFAVVDRGDPDRNVPRYNGGLFDTQPREGDASPEAAAARFLAGAAIPDRYLALGLDRLARDVDPKRRSLAMIDFKSLGVRQLGSIYEGLLEFKLRVAPEKMAVVKGKRTEEVIPYREVKRQKVRETLAKGAPYLENTRQERKATGSYYTPDYIVKYIVEHTVGPVLAEKFEALTPGIRNAQEAFLQHRRNTAVKSQQHGGVEDPEKFWNSAEMQRLAYDVLDVKVLDPAMGSGHFLVETVDFITDRLLNFLNGFPHNPVRASLSQTRQAILTAMDEQGVSVDAKRLTDVNLLKRQVLKRCVYGVDLNPMAVELAKVSLWLDAFTLGAPLSFLDHHLRCGNSLIGTTAREADAQLATMGTAPGQMTFLEGPFKGLLRSAEMMRGIGMLSDATMEQAQRSADLFASFEEAALPYKRLLDIYVMRDFGVKRADEFLRLHGVDAMKLDPRQVAKPYDEVLARREEMYRQYRFFHWDLEFPEVFIDLDKTDWKADPGFDAVVGNPPYVSFGLGRVEKLHQAEEQYLRSVYEGAEYKISIYGLFVERAVRHARVGGQTGLILPDSFLTGMYFSKLRNLLFNSSLLRHIVIFQTDFWEGGDVGLPTILIASPVSQKINLSNHSVQTSMPANLADMSERGAEVISQPQRYFAENERLRFVIYNQQGAAELVSHLRKTCVALREFLNMHHGIRSKVGRDEIVSSVKNNANWKPAIISSAEIHRYLLAPEENYIHVEPSLLFSGGWDPEEIEVPKLLIRRTGDNIIAVYDDRHLYHTNALIYAVSARKDSSVDLRYLLALLNSRLMDWFYRTVSMKSGRVLPQVEIDTLNTLPIRAVESSDSTPVDITSLGHSHADKDLERFLSDLDSTASHKETKVLHDTLVYLADYMMRLNTEKKDLERRFLGWLVAKIGARVDGLTGKTIIQGYLGDYQKGEDHLPFDDFLYRLQQNKSRIPRQLDAAFVHQLEREYQASLDVLLPVKRRLAETDWLIDQIVYRLYGLTDEEIAIVEGKG